MTLIAGVDEVGRGPLAGPVVACAVILGDTTIEGLTDSKKLSPKKRAYYCELIKEKATAYALGMASVEEIDTLNILQATFLAMQRAVKALPLVPTEVWVDGNQSPPLSVPVKTFIGGDATIACISAASIVAKVTRDTLMIELDNRYPGYGLSKHKGYGTKLHREQIHALGPSECHRRSFSPVKDML